MTEGMIISMEREGGKVTPKTIELGDSLEVQFPYPEDDRTPTRIKIYRVDGLLGDRVHIEGKLPEISILLDDKNAPTIKIRTHKMAFVLKVSPEQVEIISDELTRKVVPLITPKHQ